MLSNKGALIEEVLDLACEQLPEEISLKVMVEPDGADRPYSPLTEADYAKYRALVDSSDAVGPFADGPFAATSLFVVQEPVVV